MIKKGELPIRGDPKRVSELCLEVGSSATPRDKIVNAYEESEATIKNEIRYAVALGLMEKVEGGYKATYRGIDVGQTSPGEKRRERFFREIIADHEAYSELTSTLFQRPDKNKVEVREVDRCIRVGLGKEMGDDSRKRSATLFLRTIEAAGIGVYKQGSASSRSRLIIENQNMLSELLDLINSANSTESSSGDVETIERVDSENKISVIESGEEGEYSAGDSQSNQSGFTQTEQVTPRSSVSLNVELDLDGTEDPENIRNLVAAVREGLSQGHQSRASERQGTEVTEEDLTDTTQENGETASELDQNCGGPETGVDIGKSLETREGLNENEQGEGEAPDSSLDDFQGSE